MTSLKYKDENGFWQEFQVGTNVVANPTLTGTEQELTSLQVGDAKYKSTGGGGKLYKHIITVSGTKSNGAPYNAVWSIIDNHNKTYTFQDIFAKYYPFAGGMPVVVYSDDPATAQFLSLLNHQYKIVVGVSVQSDFGTATNFKDTVTEI